jgi:hypothetical protein
LKIEIGESLFYSWLRHVKRCQIVQTNWKPSPEWEWQHEEDLERLMHSIEGHFKPHFSVFKQTKSLLQLITQAEIDVLGLAFESPELSVYAVDVAFHEGGLNYGDTERTTSKVIQKCARAAICIRACFGVSDGEIVFASPKINPSILKELEPAIEKLSMVFREHGLDFDTRLIANAEFNVRVLEPILTVSKGVSDTAELFMRGYQLTNLFASGRPKAPTGKPAPQIAQNDQWPEMKVGLLARTVLRQVLERGVDPAELASLQQEQHSRETLGINFSLLVREGIDYDHRRYYKEPIKVNGSRFLLCSQWFETPANNDRPLLIAWLLLHGAAEEHGSNDESRHTENHNLSDQFAGEA